MISIDAVEQLEEIHPSVFDGLDQLDDHLVNFFVRNSALVVKFLEYVLEFAECDNSVAIQIKFSEDELHLAFWELLADPHYNLGEGLEVDHVIVHPLKITEIDLQITVVLPNFLNYLVDANILPHETDNSRLKLLEADFSILKGGGRNLFTQVI